MKKNWLSILLIAMFIGSIAMSEIMRPLCYDVPNMQYLYLAPLILFLITVIALIDYLQPESKK